MRPRGRQIGVALGALAIIAPLVVLAAIPLTGTEQAAWRGLGRTHVLLVHFPVALLLCSLPLAWLARRRPGWQGAADLLLALGIAGAIVTVLAGIALARADGHAGAGVTRHLWGGVGVAAAATLAGCCRLCDWRRGQLGLQAAAVGLLGWTAHEGGSLVHGRFYLTEGLPAAVRSALRLPAPPAPESYASDTVFGAAIHPLLQRHCHSCHGPDRQRGDYRMDTFALLAAGGQSGQPALVPGSIEQSELLQRIHLPDTDRRAMPPAGQPRLRPAEVALLDWWVAQGAGRDLSLADAVQRDPDFAALYTAALTPDPVKIELPKVGDYTAQAETIAAAAAAAGVEIRPISQRPGDGLILRAAGATLDAAAVQHLAPAAAYVVEADLSGAWIDDAAVAGFAAFRALESLDLRATPVTGRTLVALTELPRLGRINLADTQVDDSALTALIPLTPLRRLYTVGSRVTPAGRAAFRTARPDCELP